MSYGYVDDRKPPKPVPEDVADKLWEEYGALYPMPMNTRTRESVVAEFQRREFSTEEDIPKFLAWITWDHWYTDDPEYYRSGWKYVNVYQTDRAYGGPEEGGWWYDVGDPLASLPVHPSTTHAEEAAIIAEITSRVNSWAAGYIEGFVEDHFAQPYPQERPHYE